MTATPPSALAKLAERLRDDEIHVWHLPYRHASGRDPLRRTLAAYLAVNVAEVVLENGEHGRPRLAAAHDSTLGFNWSHSGDQAVIAIGRDLAPGIDLERLRPRPRALELARRFFSAEETAALSALSAQQQGAAFFELWTAKEAVLKALGRGIAFGLHRLTVAVEDGQLRLRRLDGDDVEAWQLQRLHLDAALVGALAWRGGARRVHIGTLASGD